VNLDDLQQRLQRPDYGLVAESLQDIGIRVAGRFALLYAGQLSDLAPWLKNAPINSRQKPAAAIPRWMGHQFADRPTIFIARS